MGAWDELDNIISAELDLSDLDDFLKMDDPYGILEPLEPIVEDLKTTINQGSVKAVEYLSNFNRSQQELYINKNCKNPSGMLASSITDIEDTPFMHTVGTIINHVYPMSVEFGHDDIYPVEAKALAFYYKGELIFRKHVRDTFDTPRPFSQPAYDDTDKIAEKIMVMEIAHAGINWD